MIYLIYFKVSLPKVRFTFQFTDPLKHNEV